MDGNEGMTSTDTNAQSQISSQSLNKTVQFGVLERRDSCCHEAVWVFKVASMVCSDAPINLAAQLAPP